MPEVLFNNARGAASSLQMTPPFAFSDVTLSVFPLRASLPSLENFTRNYLNQAPHLVQFRPFVPFVYLVILDYGRMSLEAANMGWVSQREVAFGIPLRWFNGSHSGPRFHDWAFTSPFIFVDNELSMSTGREVYGWPKLLARLDPSVSEWVRNPHGARRVFQVSTKGANKAYEGETSVYRPLLSVYQHRTAGILDIPPSLDALVKPLSQMADTATTMSRLGADLTRTFLGMASGGITGSDILPDFFDEQTLRDQLRPERLEEWRDPKNWGPGLKDALWSLFPRLYANTINFKQFRDAANPRATCYQAITAARMPVKSVKQGGFLGPQNMMLGQLDGGFSIDIHHLAGLPIIESLGLEVAQEREADGALVSTLYPVAPLWMKVDMTYGVADSLIWRGRKGDWVEGEVLRKARQAAAEEDHMDSVDSSSVDMPSPDVPGGEGITDRLPPIEIENPEEVMREVEAKQSFDYIRAMNIFNTARGASEAVGGSFMVPDASIRVLPIKANAGHLRKFVRNYLRVENHMRFEAWGDYVYLVISHFDQMNSELSAIAKRRARELSLLVPVKCYQWFDDGEYAEKGGDANRESDMHTRRRRGYYKLLTTGFVNAFTYVDDVETAITANEVFGVPSMGSTIVASENDWLTHDFGINKERRNILKMKAQVLPELMVGAKAVDRTLVELTSFHHYHERVQETRDQTVSRWIGVLADDLEQKASEIESVELGQEPMEVAQGFALKLLSGENSFNQFSLKQFRDSRDTADACYQGLILRRHKILKLDDFREIEGPLHVSITDFPTQPITELLGLVPKFSYPGRDRIVRVFESVRPLSLNADIFRGRGVTLFERVGNKDWERVDTTEEIFGWRAVPEDQIATMVANAEELAPLELTYTRRLPGTETEVEKRHGPVKPRFLRAWYEARVKKGEVTNVLIRNRKNKAVLSVLSDPQVQAKLDPRDKVGIAAWTRQMVDKETTYKQAVAAMMMEKFTPATVVDRVLSRQWGLSCGSALPHFSKPDFCVPVHSVPEDYAEKIFPQSERQSNFWPHSTAFFQHESGRRRSEVNAYKMELKSAFHLFAFLLPAALVEQETGNQSVDWDIEQMVDFLTKTLNRYLDDVQLEVSSKNLVADDSTGDGTLGPVYQMNWEEIATATEEIVFNFLDVHLPPEFRLQQGKAASPMDQILSSQIGLINAREWRKLADGLRTINHKISLAVSRVEAGYPFRENLQQFIDRAEENAHDMDMVEAATGHDADTFQAPVSAPHIHLRNRLAEVFAGEDATGDTR